ncbi:Cationic peroxidase 1 [Dendrobium catenatum]|uniref:Peroxidase n=1 Tax=Dendrobium catenatum TaxID=906689 RepID=A0A2I0W9Z8_9ASPA|nr:Cationic peroxidase 1 [Dendrobium catenatum]
MPAHPDIQPVLRVVNRISQTLKHPTLKSLRFRSLLASPSLPCSSPFAFPTSGLLVQSNTYLDLLAANALLLWVLLDDTANFTGEKTAFPNKNSLRGFDVIDSIKSQVEAVCTQIVSCADILAVAARDSVVALGGPSWTVKLGRRDSTTASLSTANSDLPGPNLDLSALITAFSNKGLSTTDLIALSGAHTIGQARCVTFRNRIYNETNIDSSYASSLQANCPSVGGDDNFSDLDVQTPTTFDNNYYVNLVNNKGLLHSDQQLFNGGSTDSQVKSYTTNSDQFSTDFAAAIINMGDLNPLTGTQGEIRISCRKIN